LIGFITFYIHLAIAHFIHHKCFPGLLKTLDYFVSQSSLSDSALAVAKKSGKGQKKVREVVSPVTEAIALN
jgi:hypothetical protein